MSENEREKLKQQVKESYLNVFGEAKNIDYTVEEDTPRPMAIIRAGIEDRIEAEAISIELIEKLQPIVASRKKLREAEEELNVKLTSICEMFPQLFKSLSDKLDALTELKKENTLLEREVLKSIKAELTKA